LTTRVSACCVVNGERGTSRSLFLFAFDDGGRGRERYVTARLVNFGPRVHTEFDSHQPGSWECSDLSAGKVFGYVRNDGIVANAHHAGVGIIESCNEFKKRSNGSLRQFFIRNNSFYIELDDVTELSCGGVGTHGAGGVNDIRVYFFAVQISSDAKSFLGAGGGEFTF